MSSFGIEKPVYYTFLYVNCIRTFQFLFACNNTGMYVCIVLDKATRNIEKETIDGSSEKAHRYYLCYVWLIRSSTHRVPGLREAKRLGRPLVVPYLRW